MALEIGGLGDFDYELFTRLLEEAGFSEMQSATLDQRLNLLESFVDVKPRDTIAKIDGRMVRRENIRNPKRSKADPNIFAKEPGTLTIVDLTDPVVDQDSACALFDICLSIFISQTSCGKIIALDEAHNYMGEKSAVAANFTERLLKSIREQRHQGARVVIATQEPSINPRLLDLCNITLVHRFTSPAWYAILKDHLAGLKGQEAQDIFERIVGLKTGESLLFCPTAAIEIDVISQKITNMNTQYFKFRTRSRITADGGRSKLADGK
jgi:DNA helicase HerA-like ATPase